MTDGAVNIRVKAPSTDTKGRAIKSLTNLRLYRTGSSMPIATLTDGVSPGATVVISDNEPVFGDNAYTITATNADGQGLEAEVTVNTKAPAPVAVDEVNVRTTNNGRDVVVSWTYPEGYPSKTGEKLDLLTGLGNGFDPATLWLWPRIFPTTALPTNLCRISSPAYSRNMSTIQSRLRQLEARPTESTRA